MLVQSSKSTTQNPPGKSSNTRRRSKLQVSRLCRIWPKTNTAPKQGVSSCLAEGYHHQGSAMLTPTVGDHCKGENTKTDKNKQKGKLTELREKLYNSQYKYQS